MSFYRATISFALLWAAFFPYSAEAAEPVAPQIGDKAPDFTLPSITGSDVSLTKSLERGPVVVVVLRGYPGYQCPLCTKQVGSLISAAKEFEKRHTQVIMVYPGEGKQLDERAKEFLKGTELPDQFDLVLDKDYLFTKSYGLRWEAGGETAYPATFVVDQSQKVRWCTISKSHGGRAETKKIIDQLP